MLITKEVNTKWTNSNRGHYESKGYKFNGILKPITIKASDLPHASKSIIEYQCENCGKIISTSYNAYFKNIDNLCKPCVGRVKQINNLDNVVKYFAQCGYKTIDIKRDYVNSGSKIEYICNIHGSQSISYSNLRKGFRCKECYRDSITGSNHRNWQGGITNLSMYLRLSITYWTQRELQRSNYKCEITGKSGNLNVHHMYSFKNIVQDTMNELNMDIRSNIGDYSEDELQLITINFVKNNELYSNPIVMLESIHQEFHWFCGGTKENTSIEQLEDFKALLQEVK